MNSISSEETKDWAGLPRNIMFQIFAKLGVFELLFSAQMVCSSWWQLSKDPSLFLTVDIRVYNINRYSKGTKERVAEKVAIEALDRSCGKMVKFRSFVSDRLLQHIAYKANSSLTCLQLLPSPLTYGLVHLVRRCSLLQELDLDFSLGTEEVIEAVTLSCKQLKTLRVYKITSTETVLLIAKNMPQLHWLYLPGSNMTEDVLRAILNGCPNLQFLFLNKCPLVLDPNSLESWAGRCRDLNASSGCYGILLRSTE